MVNETRNFAGCCITVFVLRFFELLVWYFVEIDFSLKLYCLFMLNLCGFEQIERLWYWLSYSYAHLCIESAWSRSLRMLQKWFTYTLSRCRDRRTNMGGLRCLVGEQFFFCQLYLAGFCFMQFDNQALVRLCSTRLGESRFTFNKWINGLQMGSWFINGLFWDYSFPPLFLKVPRTSTMKLSFALAVRSDRRSFNFCYQFTRFSLLRAWVFLTSILRMVEKRTRVGLDFQMVYRRFAVRPPSDPSNLSFLELFKDLF